MQNPSRINKPALTNPIGGKKNKGNRPYLQFRRKMRKNMWG